ESRIGAIGIKCMLLDCANH
ncbi:hypothetical protein GWI33_012795, partial [Rhynchophorus ferrugineus]